MSLHHVALECPPDRAGDEVAFWGLLGFAEVAVPATLAGRTRWVEREGTQVHLLLADAPTVPRHGHVAVVAPDHAATAAALRAAGHEVEERSRHWGAARSFVHSPVGHLVELMAFPPPAS